MVKHVVFDFGGVILDLDGVHTGYPNDLALILNVSLKKAQEIWEENKTAVMTGTESPKEFLARIKKELGMTFDVDTGIAFWEGRNQIAKDQIDWKLVSLLENLKKEYQVHMLTDQISLNNGANDWIHEINQHFHTIFRSYEQGFRKPHLAAYENLLQKIRATSDPSSVIFIDDAEKNIIAANQAGIQGILYSFKNHVFLKSELRKRGVTIQT